MASIFLTPFANRGYTVAEGVVSKTYHFEANKWTEVSNPTDLAYLLANDQCVLEEQTPLGNKAVRCTTGRDQLQVSVEDIKTQSEMRLTFRPGEVRVVSLALFKLLNRRPDFTSVSLVESLTAVPEARTLIIRPRGLGDILLSLPALHALKQRFPAAELWYCCDHQYRRLFWGNPDVARAVGMMEAYEYAPFGIIQDVSYGVESHPASPHRCRVDLFADLFGLPPVNGAGMFLASKPEERKRAFALIGDMPHPWVVVHVEGANWRRCPSPAKLVKIMKMMVSQGMTPICVHHISGNIWDLEGVVNLTGKTSIGELVGVVDVADGVLCGDSGVTHIANALRKPTVALYGHVFGGLRIKDQPNCIIIQGNQYCGCPPCNDHQHHQCGPPPACLEKIPNELIVEKLAEVI